MNHAAWLSFACGFASLSVEILWVRLYGFAESSTPAAFGFVLAAYLLGIAFGAAAGARACARADSPGELWRLALLAVLVSVALTPALPSTFAALRGAGIRHPGLDIALVAVASAVLSFVFPIAHHLGAPQGGAQQGRRFARVYTANVAGAALGPLVTGYLLLDWVSLQTAFLALAALQLVCWAGLTAACRPRALRGRGLVVPLVATACIAAAWLVDPHALLQPLGPDGRRALAIHENRQGIITVFADAPDDHSIYGGNVYDGRTNLDPQRNTNGLQRPILATVMHPQPRRVLMVGLSIGSWLAVVRGFPGIESIDVVEINPGYVSAMQAYPAQLAALRDPRVHLVVDDGRRWLRANPQRRYDVVIMNTSLHWRANATMLLSREQLELLRSHMAPGAILAYNATSSPDAFYTATRVFAHAYRYSNFIYAADFDFRSRKDEPRAAAVLRELQLGGAPLFTSSSPSIRQFLDAPFVSIEDDRRAVSRPLDLVTDDNMVTEFRHGRSLYFLADFFSLR